MDTSTIEDGNIRGGVLLHDWSGYHSRQDSLPDIKPSSSLTNSEQATIDCGRTLPTLQPYLFESSLLLAVVELSRVPLDGGLETTVLTTDTPTPKRTRTPFARASYTHISGGC